jgi:hypothetical protein
MTNLQPTSTDGDGITSRILAYGDGETYTAHSFTDGDHTVHTAVNDSGSIFLDAVSPHGITWKYHLFVHDADKIIALITEAAK